ncbi:MAG: hypothetical protein HQK87_06755 [Nitrospinae bacterium]|nr:hypothetical protein [Nitrospinota bacterium]
MRPVLFPLLLATLLLWPVPAARGATVDLPVSRTISGQFLTNVAGTSVTQPPYIQVMRSREGFEYTLSQFASLKNRTTQQRIQELRRQVTGIDWSRQMIIGLFSPPMDNFALTLTRLSRQTRGGGDIRDAGTIIVEVKYRHEVKSYSIPPKKTIDYQMLVVAKSDLPVILRATEEIIRNGGSGRTALTVTGRLMPLTGDDLQLVPEVIKRGNKNCYYIRGEQALRLEQYIGRVITLQGTVSPERNSPYEFELDVEKVLKLY